MLLVVGGVAHIAGREVFLRGGGGGGGGGWRSGGLGVEAVRAGVPKGGGGGVLLGRGAVRQQSGFQRCNISSDGEVWVPVAAPTPPTPTHIAARASCSRRDEIAVWGVWKVSPTQGIQNGRCVGRCPVVAPCTHCSWGMDLRLTEIGIRLV